MNKRITLALLFSALAICAHAAENTNRVVEITSPGLQRLDTPVIEDLGDLRPLNDKPLLDRIHVDVGMSAEYTSNARLIGNHGSSDLLLRPSLVASLHEPLQNGFSLDARVRAEAYIYAEHSRYSFWGFSNLTRLNYQPIPEGPNFYIGIAPYWYDQVRTGNQLASAFGITTGMEKSWAFNHDQTVIYLGYNFTNFWVSPSADDRGEHTAVIGVTQQLRPAVYAQLYYSYTFDDFNRSSREDSRSVVGFHVVREINERWSVMGGVTFVHSDSNQRLADYEAVNVGGGVVWHF